MAEVERARSTRWRRIDPADAEAAEREWVRAEALDGGRMPGLGEVSSASHPADAEVALALPGGDEARLDGRPVPATGVAATRAGPHALVVTADGAPVWAGWIEARPGSFDLRDRRAGRGAVLDRRRRARQPGGRDAARRARPVRPLDRGGARSRAGDAPDRHVRGRPVRSPARVARRPAVDRADARVSGRRCAVAAVTGPRGPRGSSRARARPSRPASRWSPPARSRRRRRRLASSAAD